MLLCYCKEIGINPNYKARTLQNFEVLQPYLSEGINPLLITGYCLTPLPPIIYISVTPYLSNQRSKLTNSQTETIQPLKY